MERPEPHLPQVALDEAEPEAETAHLTGAVFTYRSPLPPARQLAEYEAVLPGLADRLTAMAEAEQRHRHTLRVRALEGDIADTRLGQWLGFCIGTVAIAAGAYVALRGAEWAGAIIGGGGIVGLTYVFVQGRRHREEPEG